MVQRKPCTLRLSRLWVSANELRQQIEIAPRLSRCYTTHWCSSFGGYTGSPEPTPVDRASDRTASCVNLVIFSISTTTPPPRLPCQTSSIIHPHLPYSPIPNIYSRQADSYSCTIRGVHQALIVGEYRCVTIPNVTPYVVKFFSCSGLSRLDTEFTDVSSAASNPRLACSILPPHRSG